MKVLATIAFCLAAALAVEAQTNACSAICGGVCVVSKQACDLTVVLGPVCDLFSGVCSKVCDLGCKCPEQCDTECGPALTTCRANNVGNYVGLAECTITFGDCAAACKEKCFSGLITGIMGNAGKKE